MSSRRGKEMKTSSRMLQFNRPDSCKETILVQQEQQDKFQFQEKKMQNLMKEKITITVTHPRVLMTVQKQMQRPQNVQLALGVDFDTSL